MSLTPCPACSRHVHTGSTACPFCAASLDPVREAPIFRASPRVGRAAILAFRTLALGAAGCGVAHVPGTDAGVIATDTGVEPDDAGVVAADAGEDAGTIVAMYGGPVPPPDAGFDAGGAIALYGGPTPALDAGPDEDAGSVMNLYGAPPGA